ncbi:CAAX geranylgeranyltransferase alpha subunit [Lobosporangium transversale]|uniref:Protein farnesyltransferase/geranylgeranyltransferase type-1 subunit alpha n=1 Tax=Lobosporangium transversale TaxID=64571 RepID=A0A1Y2GGY7_9FUNG|nr:hypothetical protein BCR41DRAFT_359078 [Lobosporangium transversale]KAF9912212.1 CAAX geranylgeranyltransferase alpha subunit [Lobosporangium transversale]ORZ08818.1 hypothetical protein BCR41DRAFT_359078 [Lobosporangium transversale]|eukprot:XP_021878601.1 hypothetical protein BCR41DRAFT_359078 [Lobosporangium transversale]
MESKNDDIPFYESSEWADVVPIPQDDGPNPLVPIAYTKEYSTTMGYFRAICQRQEQSERALELTKIVIELSPSHYTVWHYRQRLLKALNKDLTEELEWVEWMSNENPKSYQIWHHRQVIIEHSAASLFPTSPSSPSATPTSGSGIATTASSLTTTPTIPYHDLSESQKATVLEIVHRELTCIASAFQTDSKNYHAWSYRQWVLTHFGPGPWWDEELTYIDELLTDDVRNNSAWNQRYFVVAFGPKELSNEIVQREVEYAKSKIERTPNNESPWTYLTGVLKKAQRPLSDIKDFCERLHTIPRAKFSSPFLHSTLMDIYEQEAKENRSATSLIKAKEAADLLAEKIDTIRSKYWNWRKTQLQTIPVDV